MKIIEVLMEATPGMSGLGIPKKLAAKLASEYTISHDEKPETLDGTPTKKKVEGGLLIRINSDGSAHALRKNWSGWLVWSYNPETDKVTSKTEPTYSDAKKLLKARKNNGKYLFVITANERDEKPDSDEQSVKDREEVGVISADDIYKYMNKTFLPKIRRKLEGYADEIFATLRQIPRGYDRYGDNKRVTRGTQTAREMALAAAEAIEDVAEGGFNRETMKQFIETYGTLYQGTGSIPNNEAELNRLLRNEPAARAKLARSLLKLGKDQYDEIQELKQTIADNK